MLPEMCEKEIDIGSAAEKALADEGLLLEMLEGLRNKNETLRYNCFKVIFDLCREHGEVLYPHWDYFVGLLDSPNTYHRLSAVQLIAGIAGVDKDDKFDDIYDKYFRLLGDKGTILAAHTALKAGKIAAAKPRLREKITDMLLDIDRLYPGKQLELVKGSVIEAFGEYYEDAGDKGAIREFVGNQLHSSSPKTRKLAEAFLKKWK